MILDHLKKYNHSLDSEFHFLLAGLQDQDGGKNLHALRVNVKTQLAFFNLLQHLDPKFPMAPVRKPYRQCMKLTGKWRDLHVAAALVAKIEANLHLSSAYSSHLRDQEHYYLALRNHAEEGLSLVLVRAASEAVKDRLDRLTHHPHLLAGLNGYFIHQLNLVSEAVAVAALSKKSETLHDLRLYIKEWMLNLKLLIEFDLPDLRLKKLHHQLNQLQDLLGNWHDRERLLALMRPDKKLAPKKIRKTIELERDRYFQRAMFMLKFFPFLHLYALDVFQLLLQEKPNPHQKGKKPAAILPRRKTSRKPSFPQLNLVERVK